MSGDTLRWLIARIVSQIGVALEQCLPVFFQAGSLLPLPSGGFAVAEHSGGWTFQASDAAETASLHETGLSRNYELRCTGRPMPFKTRLKARRRRGGFWQSRLSPPE